MRIPPEWHPAAPLGDLNYDPASDDDPVKRAVLARRPTAEVYVSSELVAAGVSGVLVVDGNRYATTPVFLDPGERQHYADFVARAIEALFTGSPTPRP